MVRREVEGRELLCSIRGCDPAENREDSRQEQILPLPSLESLPTIADKLREHAILFTKRPIVTQQLLADGVRGC